MRERGHERGSRPIPLLGPALCFVAAFAVVLVIVLVSLDSGATTALGRGDAVDSPAEAQGRAAPPGTTAAPSAPSHSEDSTVSVAATVVAVAAIGGSLAVLSLLLTAGRSKWRIVLLDGRVVSLRRGRNLVGRGDHSRILVDHPTVSRRHAEIRLDGHRPRLNDLGSANGTFRNGRRILSAPLSSGDRLRFGSVVAGVLSLGPEVPGRGLPLQSIPGSTRP